MNSQSLKDEMIFNTSVQNRSYHNYKPVCWRRDEK